MPWAMRKRAVQRQVTVRLLWVEQPPRDADQNRINAEAAFNTAREQFPDVREICIRSITHRATRAHGESDDECRLITISLKEGRDILDNTHMSMDGYTNGQNSPYVGQRRIWGPHNDDENGEWPAPGTRIHHTEDRTFNITEFEDQRVWVPEEDDDDDPGYSIVGAASRGGQIRGAASRHGQSH